MDKGANEIDLSLSIVNYNNTDYVVKLLDSIIDTTPKIKKEFFIYDNASTDSPERLKELFPFVNLELGKVNLYFTKADNENIKKAKGKYILSINPDVLVSELAITKMIEFMDENLSVGAVTPHFTYPDLTVQESIASFLSIKQSLCDLIGFSNNKLKTYKPDQPIEAEVLYGACILIRREVLNTDGLKDEKFVHGWDEYDWCYRINSAGWKLYYIPDAKVIHHRSVSVKSIPKLSNQYRKIEKLGVDGYYYYYRKHYGYTVYLLLKLLWSLKGGWVLIRNKFFLLS